MTTTSILYDSLVKIVGKDFVSDQKEERYFYARDGGLMPPHEPDFVVMPKTTEEVQEIVKLVNREKVPIVPKGSGLALTGLVIPQRGGIVLDMKRMDRILEVNEKARYVVVEAGVTHGVLKSYLQKHHPHLRHSIPDAPPIATIVANAVIHGQGRLSQQHGFNSKGPPLPDLSGLFLGWFGTTGIITRLGLKLYPCKKMRDIMLFLADKAELVPDIMLRLSHTEMVEDVVVSAQPLPLRFRGTFWIMAYITGDSDEELEFKRKMVWDALWEYFENRDVGLLSTSPEMKAPLLSMPSKDTVRFADVSKGGGFQYAGPIAPIEKFPAFIRKLEEVATKYNVFYASTARLIDAGHCMMFSFSFSFNRADTDEMARAKEALDECSKFALEEGGVLWKADIYEQRLLMDKMDPNTLVLMKKIKQLLDPNGIMNPGNWEVK
jgi:glycolate oxidase